jgi:uncharacterized membrane protein YoaK (UPF0700 family)
VAQAAVLVWWFTSGGHPGQPVRLALVGLTAAAMGVQSRAVNALAVSGTSTTYLTGTITVLATELATTGEHLAMRRRLAVIVAAFTGVILETVLLIWARPVAPALPLATTLVVIMIIRPCLTDADRDLGSTGPAHPRARRRSPLRWPGRRRGAR